MTRFLFLLTSLFFTYHLFGTEKTGIDSLEKTKIVFDFKTKLILTDDGVYSSLSAGVNKVIKRSEYGLYLIKGEFNPFLVKEKIDWGIGLEYKYKFKKPYEKLWFGAYAEYDKGKFVHLPEFASNPEEFDYINNAVFIGPTVGYTLFQNRLFKMNLTYGFGCVFQKWTLSYKSFTLTCSFKH